MMVYLRSKYFITYIWLACIVIYVARAILGYGSLITVFAQLFVDLIGIYSLLYFLLKPPQSSLRRAVLSLFFLLAIMALYYVIYPKYVKGGDWLQDGGSALNQIKLVLFSISGFTGASFFTTKKRLDINILRVFFIVFWIVSILVFFYNQNYIFQQYHSSIVVNNSGYIILSILGLSFILGGNVRLLYLIIAIMISCMSAKRGAALQGIIFSALVFFLSMRGEGREQKLWWVLLAVVALIIIFEYFSDSFVAIQNRIARDGGKSSTRIDILHSILSSFFNGNPFFMLFGYGSLSTVKFAGNYAHNDFVEVMCNYGFIGLGLLLSFYYSWYKYYKAIRKQDTMMSNILLVTLLLCIYKSCLSMNLYAAEGCVLLLSAGFAMTYRETVKS